MEEISRDDILSLLGFSDPRHSYAWYQERYPNLIGAVKALIVEEAGQHLFFPKEAQCLDQREKCRRFYQHIGIPGTRTKYPVSRV